MSKETNETVCKLSRGQERAISWKLWEHKGKLAQFGALGAESLKIVFGIHLYHRISGMLGMNAQGLEGFLVANDGMDPREAFGFGEINVERHQL